MEVVLYIQGDLFYEQLTLSMPYRFSGPYLLKKYHLDRHQASI